MATASPRAVPSDRFSVDDVAYGGDHGLPVCGDGTLQHDVTREGNHAESIVDPSPHELLGEPRRGPEPAGLEVLRQHGTRRVDEEEDVQSFLRGRLLESIDVQAQRAETHADQRRASQRAGNPPQSQTKGGCRGFGEPCNQRLVSTDH